MDNITVEQIVFDFLIPIGIFLTVTILGYFLRKFLFKRLRRISKRGTKQYIEIFVHTINVPSLIWFIMLAIYLALEFSTLSEEVVDIAGKVILVLSVISITLFISNVVVTFIRYQAKRAKTETPVTSLMENVARIVIFILGILVIIVYFNIQLTPIFATLGVGGLAIALALQGTLADLFAGFYVSASKQIRVGDYLKLESGEEGYVTDITWRATQIRLLPNNLVLIPNDKLAKAVVTNYYFPEKEMMVRIPVGVHYNSDLEKVEEVTKDVAKEVMREVQGGIPDFDPYIRYREFNDFSIDFLVILRAREVLDQYLITHEFIKRLHKRFKAEGIVIPFPIRAVNYDQEQTAK
jgi:small-conductance mechanosensitive channel